MTNGLANHSAHKTNGSDLLVRNLDEIICPKTRSQQSKLLLYSDYPVAWLTAACPTRRSEGTTYILRRAIRAASECRPSADLVIKTLTRSGSSCSKRCSAESRLSRDHRDSPRRIQLSDLDAWPYAASAG